MTPRPDVIAYDVEGIPSDLAERSQFVGWKSVYQDARDGGTKEPRDPRTNQLASSIDPATWTTLAEAVEGTAQWDLDGVGYVFAADDPFVGIDLDDCRDPETGTLTADAEATVRRFATYAEPSVSGTGIHIIGRMTGPKPVSGAERFATAGRFFTMTGKPLPGYETIRDATAELAAWRRETGTRETTAPETEPPHHDDVDRSAQLWRVYHECKRLGITRETVFDLVRGSNIDKFRDRHNGDGALWRDICKAYGETDDGTRDGGDFLSVADLLATPPTRWRIPNILPADALVMTTGRRGRYKTFGMVAKTDAVVTGSPWLGYPVSEACEVVYVAAEGRYGFSQRLKARMRATNHTEDDLAGLHVWPRRLDLCDQSAVTLWIATIRRNGWHPRYVVIDTLSRCLGGRDENSPETMGAAVVGVDSIRQAFSPCVVEVVHHSDKRGDVVARGHSAFENAMDTVIVHESDTHGRVSIRCEHQRDAQPFKTIQVRIEAVDGSESVVIVRDDPTPLQWDNVIHLSAEATLKPNAKLALVVLKASLPDGLTASEWEKAAKKKGLSRTDFYRARDELITAKLVTDTGGKRGARYLCTGGGGASEHADAA